MELEPAFRDTLITLLLGVGAVALGWKPVSYLWTLLPNVLPGRTGSEDKPITLRSSDQPSPPGTAEYLKSLQEAAPGATADFLLTQALKGATIAECQRARINELVKGAP